MSEEGELAPRERPSRSLLTQSFLTSLPIVLTIGLGFFANYVQSRQQHQAQLSTLAAQAKEDGKKQVFASSEAEKGRRYEANRSLTLQAAEAQAKLEQQAREFDANAQMVASRFAQEQSTLRQQHTTQQRQQATEFARSLERQRRQTEADLLLQVIKVGDLAVARSNIEFLLQAGLISDPEGRIALAAQEKPPVLPTASGALEVRVPTSQSREGQALAQQLERAIQGGSSAAKPIRGALLTLIDAVSQEREKHSVRELAVLLAIIEEQTGGDFTPIEERCSARRVKFMEGKEAPKDIDAETCFEMIYGVGSKHGPRMGNREPGDGYRFRGRGYLQIVGRPNYARVSRRLGADYIQNPDLLLQPLHALRATLALTEDGRRKLREHPQFGVADPREFPFAQAITPLIRSVSGRVNNLQPIARRAVEMERVLREQLATNP